jgi:hypothetical protein
MGDQHVARPPTYTQKKHKQASMSGMRLEPKNTAIESIKTVHAIDRATTVIGVKGIN